jgi:hypothetical protein
MRKRSRWFAAAALVLSGGASVFLATPVALAQADDPGIRLVRFQDAAPAPPPAPGAAAEPAPPPADFGEGFGADRGEFLSRTIEEQRIQEQILSTQVQEGLRTARDFIGTAPERTIEELKLLLQSVEASRDVRADVRVQLRNQILAAIQEASRVAVELNERRVEAQERQAAAIQQQRLTEALLRNQEKIDNLMQRFNALMDEGEFITAEEEIAPQVLEIADRNDMTLEGVVGVSAMSNARFVGNYSAIMSNRDLRQRNLLKTLLLVEQAAVAFPDEPPIVYPPAEFWEDLTIRRKKYASVDLAQQGPAEQKIFEALDQIIPLEFIETPLRDVIDYLKDAAAIPIEIDTKALDDVGLTTDTPVTRNLKGVTLRSGLRLILKDLDLTYMVRDEVLLITTPEEAETQLVTKVYPVADLVVPIMSGGLNPFQGGGGLGGGGGNFNGGGMGGGGFGGGMGGGMGGGFGGGGFGGGFFDVKDGLSKDLTLGVRKPAATAAAAPRVERANKAQSKAQPITVTPQPGETAAQAWERRFAEAKEPLDLAAVRETARQLMQKRRFQELISMIQSALRHGQPQPWMYEALGLAMQAAGSPPEDLERALMSAVDFSESWEEIMHAAAYMSQVGLDARALSIYREVSTAVPHRHEPYVLGLAAAQRLKDQDGVQWACLGIIRQAWPKEERHIQEKAERVAQALILEMQQAGDSEKASQFEQAMRDAQARDVRIVVTWTGDADLDLIVEEPSGMICSLRNQRTTSGGVLLGDTYAAAKGAGINGYREIYECPEGFSGVYRLLLRRIWGNVTAGQAMVDIYTHYGDPQQEEHIRQQVPIGEKDALVIFDLADGRRQESLDEAQIETIAKAQFEVNRAILGQQLSQTEGSSASRSLAADRARRVREGALPVRSGRNVGFRPVITTLPEGTNFQASAVISADRRYVRVTSTPFFSLIGDVSTFNFATGNSTGGGGNQGIGVGGFGGGVGGLGGGF